MSIFGSKPKPVLKPSGAPSTTSAKLSIAPTGKPRHPLSAPTQSTGTTEQQASAIRRMTGTIAETHELAGQAVGLLHELATPNEKDGPSQIDELLQALVGMMESQKRIEQKLDRLSAVLRPRPV